MQLPEKYFTVNFFYDLQLIIIKFYTWLNFLAV